MVDSIVTLAVKLLDLVVGLIGTENAKALLSPEAVSRANAVADAAEYVRFGKSSAGSLAQD